MDYAERQRNPGKHLVGIGVVIVFHIILIYALVNGLARKVVEVVKGPLETKIIQEVKPPPPEAPPPPPPKLLPPPPAFIPPPEVNITEAAPVTNTITTTSKPPPPSAPIGQHKAPVVRTRSCDEPEYPPASERLGETGRVVVAMLIDTNGHVVDSKIKTSSGYPRLDKAAQQALSLCKFDPGMDNGKPVQAWGELAYVFKNPNP
jgi:periplasmic protein TonB